MIGNIDPQPVYNQINEFQTIVEQEKVDVTFMTESWEPESKTWQEAIQLKYLTILSNVFQRKVVTLLLLLPQRSVWLEV